MKGAIGNAFILNMVITFILIFYMLLIGSMAYSKAYKVKNYLLNSVVSYDEKIRNKFYSSSNFGNDRLGSNLSDEFQRAGSFGNYVDESLHDYGYILSTANQTCPEKDGYSILRDNYVGGYDYCIYWNFQQALIDENSNNPIYLKYNYMVLVYMKFDFPVIGDYIKIPMTGETKTITIFR